MEKVALLDGEPTWVFPPESATPEVVAALAFSGARLREIAKSLGGRAGWTGSGLEYWQSASGKWKITGGAENPQVTFFVELCPPGFYECVEIWTVHAEIAVRCDHMVDCGMHRIESRHAYPRTGAACVDSLDELTAWLLTRHQEVPPATWRSRDRMAAEV
ncbi:MAG: hypothetical protein FWF02_08090 [Micrococcales bacterium]|nr:hypothetical protein [Micrococcales bacterium]MCL2667650.1 hypothetical protein [Micrococcales bacterium]